MTKVLLIDDDRELTGLLVEYLQEEGFDAHAVDDPRLGLEEATSNAYEIVVLDVMMPRLNGVDVLQRIRKASNIPILMLSARGENIDRIMGLNLGADDYVSKPCSPAEIVARLRAILRRYNQGSDTDPASHTLQGGNSSCCCKQGGVWKGNLLDLTGAEFSLLEVLARNARAAGFEKRDIAQGAWACPHAVRSRHRRPYKQYPAEARPQERWTVLDQDSARAGLSTGTGSMSRLFWKLSPWCGCPLRD